ncbi:SBBP repeat-containing protein [Dinghuibacter silviterrae]|uniref:Beta-propeller repeat-containing protein n=1 Tax=Dinghuibacter silviterrae TaxID=1539049 RepID=A0A4R8DXZ2_9BACT|nr:SBBP repeat-containing protein [Dinghuibacter silviterrae]TDX02317.1 beta-propeller repeat-containing protein [Dinghuibacter silviterrae]
MRQQMRILAHNRCGTGEAFFVTLNGQPFKIIAACSDSVRAVVPPMAGSGNIVLSFGNDTFQGPQVNYQYVVTVSTIAGTGAVGSDNGPALSSSFYCPWGITTDANGDLYIADNYNRLLRKYTASSATVSQITIPDTLPFYSPYNIALDRKTHNLYVTDFNVHLVKVQPDNSFTLIYNGTMPTTGIAVGPDGFLYMSNNNYGTVTRLDTNGNNQTLFGNNILTPRNLTFDRDGNLYVAAYGIYRITPGDVQKEIYLDTAFKGWEIARDAFGNIYEADHFNNNLRMIEACSGKVFTIAGSGAAEDVDGIGLNASFNGPQGLCIDDRGVLYMTTFNYGTNGGNKVRKITIR